MRIFDDFNLDHKRNVNNTPVRDYNCMGYALDAYSWLIAYLEDEETDAFNYGVEKENQEYYFVGTADWKVAETLGLQRCDKYYYEGKFPKQDVEIIEEKEKIE